MSRPNLIGSIVQINAATSSSQSVTVPSGTELVVVLNGQWYFSTQTISCTLAGLTVKEEIYEQSGGYEHSWIGWVRNVPVGSQTFSWTFGNDSNTGSIFYLAFLKDVISHGDPILDSVSAGGNDGVTSSTFNVANNNLCLGMGAGGSSNLDLSSGQAELVIQSYNGCWAGVFTKETAHSTTTTVTGICAVSTVSVAAVSIIGSPVLDTGNKPSKWLPYQAKRQLSALKIPNSDAFINFGNPSGYSYMSAATYMVLVKPHSDSLDGGLITKHISPGYANYNLFATPPTRVQGVVDRNTLDLTVNSPVNFVSLDQWQLLVFTYDTAGVDTDQKLFKALIGEKVSECSGYTTQRVGSGAVTDFSTADFYVGNYDPGYSWGRLDNSLVAWAGVWQGNWTLPEVQRQWELLSSGKIYRPSSNVFWSWLNNENNCLDLSGNGNHGAVSSGIALSTGPALPEPRKYWPVPVIATGAPKKVLPIRSTATQLLRSVDLSAASSSYGLVPGLFSKQFTTATIISWIYPNTLDQAGRIFSRISTPTTHYCEHALGIAGSGRIYWNVGRATTGISVVADAVNFSYYNVSAWNFVVGIIDSTGSDADQKLLIGNLANDPAEPSAYASQQVGSGAVQSGISAASYIGNNYLQTENFNGQIALIAIWDRVLTPTEYNLQRIVPQPTPGCLAFWSLNSSVYVRDESGNKHPTTTFNNVSVDDGPGISARLPRKRYWLIPRTRAESRRVIALP